MQNLSNFICNSEGAKGQEEVGIYNHSRRKFGELKDHNY